MKKRILFVDDEPQILEGLQSVLRKQRNRWDMSFSSSGKEALSWMAETEYDVIITDMRMPEMDGATLLKNVKEQHPNVIRIVLSGHSELETAMRAVPVSHQFLSKPCHPGNLENVIERACDLQALINDQQVRRMVSKIDQLPSIPQVYSQLITALTNERITAREVSDILQQDQAICAKLMQLVNSGFFGLSRHIAKIEEAVIYLGFNTVKQLALAVGVFQSTTHLSGFERQTMEGLQQHSMQVGGLAGNFFQDKQQKEDAFIAGLLHDIGKLVMVIAIPEHLKHVAETMQATGESMHAIENRLSGATHAEIGGFLLGLWGLPYPIVEAVANHHVPGRVKQDSFDVLSAVYVANILVRDQAHAGRRIDEIEIDRKYLETIGVMDKLESWRELARKEIAKVSLELV